MDDLLKQAAEEYICALECALPEPESCQHTFSRRFEKKMRRLIVKTKHPERSAVLRAVACLAAAMLLLFGSVMALDVEAREAFGRWLERRFGTCIQFSGSDAATEFEAFDYNPGWIPPGFDFYEEHTEPFGKTILYVNEQGNFFRFSYSAASSGSTAYLFFHDGYDVKDVLVNGLPGKLYISRSDRVSPTLVWQDEHGTLFDVDGPCEESVLIKAAENFR